MEGVMVHEVAKFRSSLATVLLAGLTACAGTNAREALSVETLAVKAVGPKTVVAGGRVVPGEDGPVQARGFCWGATRNPSFADRCTYEPGSGGTFMNAIAGITPGVVHHVRAYAMASRGVVFGEDASFEVGPSDGPPSAETAVVDGELILFAGNQVPQGFLPADGRSLPIAGNEVASVCIAGEDLPGPTFTVPRIATAWPAGLGIGQPGTLPGWLIATGGSFCSLIQDAYRGQVVFTQFADGIWEDFLDDWLPGSGATRTTMGSLLGPGVTSVEYQYDGGNSVLVGEVRLFRQDNANLEWTFLVANGAEFSMDTYPALAALIGQRYGGTGDAFRVPNLQAPAGYLWAIAYDGMFPVF